VYASCFFGTIADMKKITRMQEAIGWIGAISLVSAYTLLTADFFSSKDLGFNLLQLLGGFSLAYRVWLDRNWSNLALEVFFVSVAIYAIVTVLI